MDDLFAQYCMLIITAFTFFFFFLLPFGMGKAFVCVLGGGVKNNYPKLFNVLLFFFASTYTILSSDLRPPFGPMASWRLKVFCTLWWMLIGVFITQSWMSFLVCSFLSLILSSFRHHHVFSKVRKHCFGLFQKRSQMLHSTHEGPLAQIWSPARKRMNDRKKKKERQTL